MLKEPLDPLGVRGTPGAKLMRQSMIGQADVCNLRLAYDRKYGGGFSEARIVGTAYHAGVAAHYRHEADIAQGENPDPFFSPWGEVRLALEAEVKAADEAGVKFEWTKFGSQSAALEAAQKMVRHYLDHFAVNLELFEVLAVEVPWWWPLADGWIAHGTIDLVVRDRTDGTHWLHDHKTAGRPWKKGKEHARANAQPSWYLGFWPTLWSTHTQTSPPVARFAFDIMTYELQFERRIADVKRSHVQRVFDKATLVARLLDGNGPFTPNTSHFLCDERWCDHWSLCPFGGGLDTDESPFSI